MKKTIIVTAALAMTTFCNAFTADSVHAADNRTTCITNLENCPDLKELSQKTFLYTGNCSGLLADILKQCDITLPDFIPSVPDNTPSTPEQTPSDEENADTSFANQVVTLVNEERAKENLTPLIIDETIETAALIRASEIQTRFSHTRPDGSSFSTALQETGTVFRSTGENIAWGQKTPQEVVTAWMNSSGHRANIMNPDFSRIGVGHLTNADGISYWVQLFAN